MQQQKVPNKYNLKVSDIPNLIVDRNKIKQHPFWYNSAIHAWCISDESAKTGLDEDAGCYNSYWLGVYDTDATTFAGQIILQFSSYGGACGYEFNEFYSQESIDNYHDLRIQELFLSRINRLIDNGTFKLPN